MIDDLDHNLSDLSYSRCELVVAVKRSRAVSLPLSLGLQSQQMDESKYDMPVCDGQGSCDTKQPRPAAGWGKGVCPK